MIDNIVINLIAADSYLLKPLSDNKTAFELVIEGLSSIESETKPLFLLPKDHSSTFFKAVKKRLESVSCDIEEIDAPDNKAILNAFPSKSGKVILYLQGDAPFYDIKNIALIEADHRAYGVQYSNGDGFPLGIIPEMVSSDIIPALIELSDRKAAKEVHLAKGDTLFDLILADINSFDIETKLPPKDYSLLRLKLFARGLDSFLICQSVYNKLKEGSFYSDKDKLCRFFDDNLELLRTRPAFYAVQITEQCPHSCSFCPWPIIHPDCEKPGKEMTVSQLETIAKKAVEFSDAAVISLSLWGEPALHSKIEEMINVIMQHPSLTLLIETSGIGWNDDYLTKLSKKYQQRIIWIVSLDADNKELYQQLRGEGFDEALKFAKRVKELFPETSYQQALRVKENEDDLINFWKLWSEEGRPLVQKYDHFCNQLPDRKVVDLSPLKRFPCWHLKRDISVLIDGTVPLCREDLKSELIMGNIFKDSMESIFSSGDEIYRGQCKGQYNKLCGSCDEYYTCNF